MALTLTERCPECGKKHQLFVRGATLLSGRKVLAFVCPKTDNHCKVAVPDEYDLRIRERPDGSVVAKLVNY